MKKNLSKYKNGMKTREEVLGRDYLSRVNQEVSEIDGSFQELITEYAWGTVWSNDTLTKRERSMLTIALLAAGGNLDELRLHIKACTNTKTSAQDMMEALMHVAIYAGVPKANSAIKILKEEITDWD